MPRIPAAFRFAAEWFRGPSVRRLLLLVAATLLVPAVWAYDTLRKHADFRPAFPGAEDANAARTRLRAQASRQAHEALVRLEDEQAAELPALVALADRFLLDHPASAEEPDVRRRRDAYLHRLDERDIDRARTYSADHPLDFGGRREQYRRYLDLH